MLTDAAKTRAQLIAELTELRTKIAEPAHERAERLNQVLRAIRAINHLIVSERDCGVLIRRACEILVETRGYRHAWIALTDASRVATSISAAGLDHDFAALEERMRAGDLPVCCRSALDRGGVFIADDPLSSCESCPLASSHNGATSGVAVPIAHDGELFGAIGLSIPSLHAKDPEEIALVQELAADLGLALHGLHSAAERRQAERDLEESEARFRSFFDQAPIGECMTAADGNLLRVNPATLELTAANRELEAFAYSVSHDLRAPLRGIDGFSKALLDDYQDQLDATALDYIGRVRAATQRMGRLIDDLLELSRMTRAEMNHQRLDLTELGRKIVAELHREEPARSVDFAVCPGLMARGDRALLAAALGNLVGNAWKFSGQREHAHIELGVTAADGEDIYYVRDDGAGFDMAYADKLFGPFQRLHDTAEFPGSGIGLAIVQRVILRHGGRIWAESEVDKGATFYFTLPTTSGGADVGAES